MTHEQKAKDAILESVSWLHDVTSEHRSMVFATIALAEATLAVAAAHSGANLAAPSVPATPASPLCGPVGGPKSEARRTEHAGSVPTCANYVLTYGNGPDTITIDRGIEDIDVARDMFIEHVQNLCPFVRLTLIDETGREHEVASYNLQLF